MADTVTPKTRYVPPQLRDRRSHSPSAATAGPSNYASSSNSAYSSRSYPFPSTRSTGQNYDASPSTFTRRPLILTSARSSVQPAASSADTSSPALVVPLAAKPSSTTTQAAASSEKYRAPGKRYTGQNSPPASDIFAPARPKSVAPNGIYGDRFCDFHIYGDSFVGPFSLLRPNSVYIRKFKGASAKGLNNLKSFKRVALELVPELAGAMVEGPRSDAKIDRRNAMFMFGNVSWQNCSRSAR
jgi:hypothetical protein